MTDVAAFYRAGDLLFDQRDCIRTPPGWRRNDAAGQCESSIKKELTICLHKLNAFI